MDSASAVNPALGCLRLVEKMQQSKRSMADGKKD
jgi:hypothetical protein